MHYLRHMDLREFIAAHLGDDPASLALHRDRWPDVDVALAADCIAAKRKLRGKVQEWYGDPRILIPSPLSAEQCSSTLTARHKAVLALQLAGTSEGLRLADLTGGLGVDSWQFAAAGATVLYNEMNPVLADAARENFAALGYPGISVSNLEITASNIGDILDGFKPDIVYLDPARRGSGGRKVFRLEDCSPKLLEIQDIILGRGIRLMAKLSPVADVSLLGRSLHNLKEIHIVEASGECKELLALCEPEFDGEYSIVVEIAGATGNDGIRFLPSEESTATAIPAALPDHPYAMPDPLGHLFEPGPALMKSGAFKLIAQRFGIHPLGPSAHLYLVLENAGIGAFAPFGKLFEIQEVALFGKASLKRFASLWPDAEITARALPLSTDELRRKMALRGGGKTHIFAVGTPSGKHLISCRKA